MSFDRIGYQQQQQMNRPQMSSPAPTNVPGIVLRIFLCFQHNFLTFIAIYEVGPAANKSRAPPSEQSEPEPRKYMGGNIPSRSFRMLQAMTALDPNGETNINILVA